jgi:AraC-like DNA-binding protein
VDQLCYSVRLLIPYARVLREQPDFPSEILSSLERLDPDDRVPIAAAHELLRGAVEITHDPHVGLKAARAVRRGDFGALEYAARSAATCGQALAAVGKYARLINDALHFSIETRAERSFVHLDTRVVLPRAAVEFQAGLFYRTCSIISGYGFEVWFQHPRPTQIKEYVLTFGSAHLRFEAPFDGFAFPTHVLSAPVSESDPSLHAVLSNHVRRLIAELPAAQSLTERVRELILKELDGGNHRLANICDQLHMSQSTLARRLEDEGTSFTELLEDARRRLAMSYLARSDIGLSELAYLLGFSQTTSFHRAFKRWSSVTPLEYRNAHRGKRSRSA